MKNFPIDTIKREDFPIELTEIPLPPNKIYIRGMLPKDRIYLTVVGSRKFSPHGRDACEKIIEDLAPHSFVIVSGLAIGIDTIAHETALNVGLPTIAIPGSGIDDSVIYPMRNRKLAQNILEAGGALISEFEPETKPSLYTFPKRNRIMAGLCHGALVIEAKKKSGTLITARLALDYNRHVFAVPGPATGSAAEGSNWLIKEGAQVVTSGRDILEAFNMD